jgi:hypothetical protein
MEQIAEASRFRSSLRGSLPLWRLLRARACDGRRSRNTARAFRRGLHGDAEGERDASILKQPRTDVPSAPRVAAPDQPTLRRWPDGESPLPRRGRLSLPLLLRGSLRLRVGWSSVAGAGWRHAALQEHRSAWTATANAVQRAIATGHRGVPASDGLSYVTAITRPWTSVSQAREWNAAGPYRLDDEQGAIPKIWWSTRGGRRGRRGLPSDPCVKPSPRSLLPRRS